MHDEEDNGGGNILPFRRPGPKDVVYEAEDPYFHFSATLRIFGENLDLEAITEHLGIQPSHTHHKGERRGPRSPAYEHDMWYLEASLPEDAALEEHILQLYRILEPHLTYLKELKRTAQVDIFCGYRSNCLIAGFEVDYRALRLFLDLEVPFAVSIIVSDGDF